MVNNSITKLLIFRDPAKILSVRMRSREAFSRRYEAKSAESDRT